MVDDPAPDERPAGDLVRALAALRRVQALWLADVGQAGAGDLSFVDAFRRWQEQLTCIKLHLHRVENHLLHYLVSNPARTWREDAGDGESRRASSSPWIARLGDYVQQVRVETSYRRLPSALDLSEEAVTADIVTDLALVATTAEASMPALARAPQTDAAALDDLAFYRVVAPWRLAQPALIDVMRWLGEVLREHEDL